MSIEIDRERFFVQYWGQHVQKYKGTDANLYPINEDLKEGDLHKSFLQLRSIESLTDEELISICKIASPLSFSGKSDLSKWAVDKCEETNFATVYYKHNAHSFEIDLYDLSIDIYIDKELMTGTKQSAVTDHARSIGILVPFAQYSVEEILSLGWAVVKK